MVNGIARVDAEGLESYSAYRTAFELAKHYRDEAVPLRKRISEENLLRYNGMRAGDFQFACLMPGHRQIDCIWFGAR